MTTNKREIKRYKKSFEYSYSYGVYPTLDLILNRPDLLEVVIVSPFGNKNQGLEKILHLCEQKNIPVITSQKLILKLSKKENTYAVAKFHKFKSVLDKNSPHILLDKPSDLGNLGTIIRTMVGIGYNNLGIIKPAVDIFDPRVIRSTMGALFQIQFEYFESVEEYAEKYRAHHLYAFMLDRSEDFDRVSIENLHTLVFGNEGQGLDKKYLEIAKPVKIRQNTEIDSFNLAISAAIGMYIASNNS